MAQFSSLLIFSLTIFAQQIFNASGFNFHQNFTSASEIAKFLYDANFSDNRSVQWQEDLRIYSNEPIVIDKKIFQMVKNMTSYENSKKSGKLVHLTHAVDSISEAISIIEGSYDEILAYAEIFRASAKPSNVLESFASTVLNPSGCGLEHQLSEIHSKFVQNSFATNRESKVQEDLVNNLQVYSDMCNRKKSMSMILSDLYDVIVKTEIKALITIHFAWSVLKKYNTGQYDYPADLNMMSNESDIRVEKTRKVLKEAALQASQAVWTCDPDTLENSLTLGETEQLKNNIYFNLHPVKTDASDLMVMTGARFNSRKTKINGEKSQEIYLEIQQGYLMPDGSINASTLSWKNSLNVKNSRRHRVKLNETSVKLVAQDTVSSHTYLIGAELRLQNENTITLHTYGYDSDVWRKGGILGSYEYFDYVLPLYPTEQGNDQNLKDLVSSLRNSDGSYSYVTKYYMAVHDPWNTITDEEKKKYSIQPDQLALSTNSSNHCNYQSKTLTRYYGQFTFQETSSDEVEGEQLIVPLIDLQEVVTDPPTPLSGLALYHKGNRGCKSFLSLEIRTKSLEDRI